MADLIKAFNRYSVWIGGSYDSTLEVQPGLVHIYVVATVYCFRNDARVGEINFMESSSGGPSNSNANMTDDGERFVINMPSRRLDAVLLTLRQERPLGLLIRTTRPDPNNPPTSLGYLVTLSPEPAGEEEGAGENVLNELFARLIQP